MDKLSTLSIFLVPIIGYICVNKKNLIKKKIKPISGLELTYSCSVYGLGFLTVSYMLIKVITYSFNFASFVDPDSFAHHILQDIGLEFFYFIIAASLSFFYSVFFVKSSKEIWDGDANNGLIWYSLLASKEIIVIFLKNGKSYQGMLMEVEVSERVPIQERLVSIYVLISGCRDSNGYVNWNTKYNNPLLHHFNMAEIVSFSKYSASATFSMKKKSSNKKTN